jgi:hypothetical protein
MSQRQSIRSAMSVAGIRGLRGVPFIFFLALSVLQVSAQTSVSPPVASTLTPPDDVRSLTTPISGSASAGTSVNSAISAQSTSYAGAGSFASDSGASVRSTAGVGSSGGGLGIDWGSPGDGWTGKSEQQVRMGPISGFSAASSGFRSKGASTTERRSFNAGFTGSPPAAAISGELSAADSSLANIGTTAGTNTVHASGHGVGAPAAGGFPDSTRMAVAASPPDLGSFSLFGFSTSIGSGLPNLDNTNFLSPDPYAKRSFIQQNSAPSAAARLTAVWKEYELGITPTNRMAGNRLHTGLTSEDPVQRFKQQQRYQSEFGIYGANVIQRLKDQGLTGSGLEDPGVSH